MPDDAPRRLSPPWLRLLGLVLLAHALVLTALAPPVRRTAVAPPAPAWATRTVAAPAAAPEVQERARDAGADDGPPAALVGPHFVADDDVLDRDTPPTGQHGGACNEARR